MTGYGIIEGMLFIRPGRERVSLVSVSSWRPIYIGDGTDELRRRALVQSARLWSGNGIIRVLWKL